MKTKCLLLTLVVFIVLVTTSCGTIFIGSRECISFHSNLPSDTPVRLVVDGEQIGHKVCFPINVMVKRGYSPSFALAEAEGYKASSITIQKKFHPATLVNLIAGGIIGFAIDLGSGAISKAMMKSYNFFFEKDNDNKSDSVIKQEIVLPKTYKIGDLYKCGDKIGIIVHISENGEHGKIISLDQTRIIWSKCRTYYKSSSNKSGITNLKMIHSQADTPAIDWCIKQKGGGWYLPSLLEMQNIYKNIETINRALRLHNGAEIAAYELYWTSTEQNKTEAIAVQSTYYLNKLKKDTALVVAMAEF